MRLLHTLLVMIAKAALPISMALMVMGFAGVNPVSPGDGELSFIWSVGCIVLGGIAYQAAQTLSRFVPIFTSTPEAR